MKVIVDFEHRKHIKDEDQRKGNVIQKDSKENSNIISLSIVFSETQKAHHIAQRLQTIVSI